MLWEEKITEFLDDFNVTDVNREIILEYLDAVQDIGKNPAENTIKNKTVMMLFIAQHVKTDIDKLTKHDIINFKKVVQTSIRKDGKPLKHSTKMNYFRLSQNSPGLYIWVINIGIFIFFKGIYHIKSIFLKKIDSSVSHVQKVRSKAAIFTSIEYGSCPQIIEQEL